jgi:hypothetical protein
MHHHTDSNEMNALIARLAGLYQQVVQDGLPDTITELLSRPESREIRSIGRRLIELQGLDIMLEIGHRLYPKDDELAFTCNLLLSVIFELPFDFSQGFWTLEKNGQQSQLAS